jgi:hypothetical protein
VLDLSISAPEALNANARHRCFCDDVQKRRHKPPDIQVFIRIPQLGGLR